MRVVRPRRGRHDRPGDRARPRLVRTRSTSCCCSTSTRPRRCGRRGDRRRQGPRRGAPTRATRRRSRPRSRASTRSSTRRATGSTSTRHGACLRAGVHYLDLGGLYHVTASSQLAAAMRGRSSRAGLLALLGIGSSPGKTNLMAVQAARELGGRSDALHVIGRRPRHEPAGRPQLSLRAPDPDRRADAAAGRDPRRRAGRDRAADPGGVVDFGDPIGDSETIYTLHSEMLTFADSFGCREGSFRLSLHDGPARAPARADDAPRRRRSQRAAREAEPPSSDTVSVHLIEAAGGGRSVRVRGRDARRSRLWGLGGGVASTAAPAAAAVRLLARGDLAARGVRPPERCVDPDELFAELRRAAASSTSRVERRREEVAPMKVGVPTEIKDDEYRVALTPAGTRELTERGHEVLIQAGAGEGSAISDADYEAQGGADRPRRRGGLRRGRAAAGGQGAAAVRGRDAAPRDDAVHLPAPGAGARADRGAGARPARPASPTRRSRTPAAGCRCSRR